jgi:hypothetical protein
MSSLRKAKAVFASIVVLGSLIVAASASAAAWQGPVPIGVAGINAGDSPLVSVGAAGDAATGWWDEGGGLNGRTLLARKRAGAAWSAPAILDGDITNNFVFTGVDGAGDVTAAYSKGGTISIANWAAGAAAPTVTPLAAPTNVIVNDFAVNAAGDAVISALTNASPSQLYVGYRHGFGGTFTFHLFPYATIGVTVTNTDVAINAAGIAVVVFRAGTGVLFSARTAGTDWQATPDSVAPLLAIQDIVPTVGIDAAGNVWTAFTYSAGAGQPVIVRTGLHPAGSAFWQVSNDQSSSAAGFEASQVQIAVNPSGAALLAWKQTGAALSDASIQARFGSTGTGLWGDIQPVNDAGADTPVVAIGNDGRAAVAWERETMSGNVGQARIREPGATGTFGDIHNLSLLHANYTKPSIATDGLGDFVTASAPYDNGLAYKTLLISVYDAAPPAISTPTVTGTLLAGDPVTLAAAVTDSWSAVGIPAWTFGDGGTGSGASVAHVYAAAGTYTVHVTVTDGSGNSAAKDVVVTVASPQSTLTSAKFTAKWKVSRVSGTLNVAGTVPRAGTYDIDVFKGKTRKIHVSYALAAGAFTRSIKLPVRLVPGTYSVSLLPADAQVKGTTLDAKLAAPASGVVDVAFLSGARNGTAARTLTGARTIWASFHFAAKPKGKVTLTWYRLGKKRVRIGSTSKDVATKVVSYLRIGRTFVGTYQAVLSRKGVVIARASVKAKKG